MSPSLISGLHGPIQGSREGHRGLMRVPRINGIELLMLMQADGIHVPTIVMAGFGDFQEDELKAFSNVVKFLHKPFELEVLLGAIRKHARA